MPTPKPSHPGELAYGHSKSDAYNDAMVEFECRMSFEAIDDAMAAVDLSRSWRSSTSATDCSQRRTMQCPTAHG
jgi:hypothetical protein